MNPCNRCGKLGDVRDGQYCLHTGWCKFNCFLNLGIFPNATNNEFLGKVKITHDRTYNPDLYDSDSATYIEVATSRNNIHGRGGIWLQATALIKLRIFWWEGAELFFSDGRWANSAGKDPWIKS